MLNYSEDVIAEAVSNSTSYSGAARYLGLTISGGSYRYLQRKISEYELDVSHFTGRGHNLGVISSKRKLPSEILVRLPNNSERAKTYQLVRAMLEVGVPYVCECGQQSEWFGKKLVLQVDHIDGDFRNNCIENLRFLCPNCHSQQETSRGWKTK